MPQPVALALRPAAGEPLAKLQSAPRERSSAEPARTPKTRENEPAEFGGVFRKLRSSQESATADTAPSPSSPQERAPESAPSPADSSAAPTDSTSAEPADAPVAQPPAHEQGVVPDADSTPADTTAIALLFTIEPVATSETPATEVSVLALAQAGSAEPAVDSAEPKPARPGVRPSRSFEQLGAVSVPAYSESAATAPRTAAVSAESADSALLSGLDPAPAPPSTQTPEVDQYSASGASDPHAAPQAQEQPDHAHLLTDEAAIEPARRDGSGAAERTSIIARPERAEEHQSSPANRQEGIFQLERVQSETAGSKPITTKQAHPTAGPHQPAQHPGADSAPSLVARGLSAALAARGGSVTIQLIPETLGAVRVEMQLEQGSVAVRIHAATTSAQSLLGEHLGMLRSSLESRGITVDALSVHLAHSSASSGASAGSSAGNLAQGGDQPEQRHLGSQDHDASGQSSRGGDHGRQQGRGSSTSSPEEQAEKLTNEPLGGAGGAFTSQLRVRLHALA